MSTIISTLMNSTNLYINNISVSGVTAQIGDKIILYISGRPESSGVWGTISWNGQPFTLISSVAGSGTESSYVYELTAAATATASVTGSRTQYMRYNYVVNVIRATTAFVGVSIVKNVWWHNGIAGGLSSWSQPTLTSDALGAEGRIIDFMYTSGYSNGFSDVRPTTETSNPPITLLTDRTHDNIYVNRIASSTTTGTGAVTSGYTLTPANSPRFIYTQIAIMETTGTVDDVDGGAVYHGQQGFTYNTSGLVPNVTGITSNTPGITINGIVDVSGDGTANLNDFVEGVAYPLLPLTTTLLYASAGSSASKDIVIGLKPNEGKTVIEYPILDDDQYLGYSMGLAGYTLLNGDVIYYPSTGFVIEPNGNMIADNALNITIWVRSFATGIMRSYNLVINNATVSSLIQIDLSALLSNAASPKYDGAYPLGNRP
jgi:hypothetical protein